MMPSRLVMAAASALLLLHLAACAAGHLQPSEDSLQPRIRALKQTNASLFEGCIRGVEFFRHELNPSNSTNSTNSTIITRPINSTSATNSTNSTIITRPINSTSATNSTRPSNSTNPINSTTPTNSTNSTNMTNPMVREYERWRRRVHNEAYASTFPKYIILPRNESQVRTAVRCLVRHNLPFVVRAGGHSYRGMSTLHCGAVLDLFYLDSIDVSVRNKRVTIGAGVTLGHMYHSLWTEGRLVFPGGTCPSVGASGLLLSGGHGLLSRKLGMAVDSVLAARVVLSNGTALTADSSNNKDLFWAIRGGSGSFGIITRWTLRVYTPPVNTTQLEIGWPWDLSNLTRVISQVFEARPWTWPEDFSVVRLYVGTGRQVRLRMVLNYWGNQTAMQTAMSQIPFFNTSQPYSITWSQEATHIDSHIRAAAFGQDRNLTLNNLRSRVSRPSGFKTYWSAYLLAGLPPLGVDVVANATIGGCMDLTFTFLGAQAGSRRGTAYDTHRNESVVIQFSSSCKDRERRIARVASAFANFTTGTQYMGYIYDVPNGTDPYAAFFGTSNARRLRDIKRKYDRNNVLNALTARNLTC